MVKCLCCQHAKCFKVKTAVSVANAKLPESLIKVKKIPRHLHNDQ